jgi:O-antigen/teichoic acid export membrane protein
MAGMAIVANHFIELIPKYQKWEPALPILYFFCLNATISSLSNILVNVLDAMGQVKTTLILMIFWTVLTWIFTPIGIFLWGTTGVAVVSALITFSVVLTVILVKRIISFEFISSVWKPLVATTLMLIITFIERRILGVSWISLVVIISSGMIAYGGGTWLIAKKEVKELLSSLRGIYG